MAARFGSEGSQPSDRDGIFDSQDMPTADGEMAEGGEKAEGLEDAVDRAGMRGQLDDSMNALGEGEEADEARRGIPQGG